MIKNKSKFAGIIAAAALIAFSTISCGNDNGGGGGGGYIGETLTLSGQVYNVTFDADHNPTFTAFSHSEPLVVNAEGAGGSIGTGTLSAAGVLSFTIVGAPAGALTAWEQVVREAWGDDATVSDTAVQATTLTLSTSEGMLSRGNYTATAGQGVMFVYVDRAVTVTIPAFTDTETYDGTTYTWTRNAATLNLAAGWNAIFYNAVGTNNWATVTTTHSVANPGNMRWIID